MNAEVIKTLKNTPVSGKILINMIGDFADTAKKLSSMEHSGDIIRLKRGLYVLDGSDFGFPPSLPICSNHIYGPSYVSLQWALSFYGLIPERVYSMTAVTVKRSREFNNKLGRFTYMQVPKEYFHIGISTAINDGANFLIATREKALCDMILADPYVPNLSVIALRRYLEEDLRLDTDELADFDIEIIRQCAECGRKKSTFNNLIKIIEQL
ncbi:MAG: hypothetical protein MJ003_07430 [Paludibacteraceae bacterium]|nr:hypothetical protein [Paludibacteraceae bacterium]